MNGAAALASFTGPGPKFAIVHTRRSLTTGNAEDRPMLFLGHMTSSDDPSFNRAETIVMAPAQGTTQG